MIRREVCDTAVQFSVLWQFPFDLTYGCDRLDPTVRRRKRRSIVRADRILIFSHSPPLSLLVSRSLLSPGCRAIFSFNSRLSVSPSRVPLKTPRGTARARDSRPTYVLSPMRYGEPFFTTTVRAISMFYRVCGETSSVRSSRITGL